MAVQPAPEGPLARRDVPGRPRVLRVDLDAVHGSGELGSAARREVFTSTDPALDRVGGWSGLALALALIEERARADPRAPTPLVLAVGECVRRGVPTAARASVVSRAPLSGRLGDGQVGGDLGRRLASVADALELRGRTEVPAAVLVVDGGGDARIESRPELVGASPRATFALLGERLGPCAVLCVGPGGERGLPFASLVASGEVPHFVGRGGLGAVLGRMGLKAVVIRAEEVRGAVDRSLVEALVASPRLEGRARGGTLELFEAYAARGALSAGGQAVGGELEGARQGRHGCSGCPTPCGWVFRGPGGRGQGARFGATYALSARLGIGHAEDALALLARCDDAGLDAKEVGSALALLALARERGRLPGGALEAGREPFERWLDELLSGAGEGAAMEAGAGALARELGLEDELAALSPTPATGGEDLAALLGAAVSARGPDPMRTFPFLVHDGGESGALERLLAPLEVPAGSSDPRDPTGKGRLVWWHENLAAALDATGFCSFSAAAVLVDGELDLERLAAAILPATLAAEAGRSAAERLQELGEAVDHLARRLEERWDDVRIAGVRCQARSCSPGASNPPSSPGDLQRQDFRIVPGTVLQRSGRQAPQRLALPGMWEEYALLRGLDGSGRLSSRARERFDAGLPIADLGALQPAARPRPRAPGAGSGAARAPGRVTLRASGPLARELGGEARLELDLPAPVEEVIGVAAERFPSASGSLLAQGRPRVAVYRAGQRLGARDEVRSGDRLDLVLVISGGAR